ncbi:MAG TPA: carboxypeptidase-like regulatory domain-containing protein, partial [Bryobacteraceae bacterium]|nr:carboxypeptidase-like regulatory domain-containing protein [Bryobacteraceae bacterium]
MKPVFHQCRAWLSVIALLLVCRSAPAADVMGNISGTIFEAGGGPAALANVTLLHTGNGFHRDLVADGNGKYNAASIPAGSYSVAAASVRTGASSRVTVTVANGQTVELPIHLSSPSAAFESDGLREIPLKGRNYLEAMRNGSEATAGEEGGNIEGYTPYSPRANMSFNSVGQRGQNNNFMVDGMDNNEVWMGGAVLLPSLEEIESVRLYAVGIPATLGHTSGGSVDVGTRSGSNLFHGSGFEYLQNSAVDSRNFFDGTDKPGLRQNQFGGSLGGPIHRDWFFFVDTDLSREDRGLTVISTVPTSAEKAGQFGNQQIFDPGSLNQVDFTNFTRRPFTGNRIPLSGISQAAQNLAALYPDPNLPGDFNNYRFTPALIRNREQFDGRTDKQFGANSKVFARFSYEQQNGQSPGALPAPAGFAAGSFAGSDPVQHADDAATELGVWAGAVAYTAAIHPSLLNEFRTGVTRYDL